MRPSKVPVWLGPAIALLIAGAAAACDGSGGPRARVSEVYPSADVLPENLLRFYVYFTRPMARGDVSAAVELRDQDGRPLPGVFLSNRYELWSPDDRRLTLILDPGRVKTGLESHRRLGRALEADRRYVLTVGRGALDADGCPLAEPFEKAFTATAEDLSPPEPGRWRLDVPAAGGKRALAVELDGPHDHLSLAYRLRVLDEGGAVVPGSIELAGRESRWRFTPVDPWRAADYRLVVGAALEDLAGNRPGRRFDLAPSAGGERPALRPSPSLEIPFEIPPTPH
ncbi:MAG: Ig-like domain-containing protein [Acidobacteriota bacterium]